jgi:hypothetical protein
MSTFPSTIRFPASASSPTTATFPFGGLTLTNNQKLSLPANTAVGTEVQVTDGFVVEPGFFDQPGLYIASTVYHGKPSYAYVDNPKGSGGFNWSFRYDGSQWNYYQDDDAQDFPDNPGDVEGPWLAEFGQVADLTHPAVQQLAAPSTEQGGMFVPELGIYTIRGQFGGKSWYSLLGQEVSAGDAYSVTWATDRWFIYDNAGDPLYYSLSNVTTPDLATNWKNASDDSPASITVTNVTQGELDAGMVLNNVFYQVNGNANGRNRFSGVLGVQPNIYFNGTVWTDGTTTSDDETVAFIWNGAGDLAGDRTNVCSEANWNTI